MVEETLSWAIRERIGSASPLPFAGQDQLSAAVFTNRLRDHGLVTAVREQKGEGGRAVDVPPGRGDSAEPPAALAQRRDLASS